jgi:4-hydroxybenzoate polyprenyltransferase
VSSATFGARLHDWASLVKLSHTAFALPFALLSLLAATGGRPPLRLLLLCVAAVVAARTAAMAYNRFADRHLDAANPRTRAREIPRGAVTPLGALLLAIGAGAAFVACAVAIGGTCAAASVPVLLWLLAYSHTKRFTAACHLWLGVSLGLAPVASQVAAHDVLAAAGDPPGLPLGAALVLGLGVAVWVAGFDIVYAAQDEAFDRAHGLRSAPVRLGAAGALRLARALHVAAVLAFAAFGVAAGLAWGYAAGVAAAAGLLLLQHRRLSPGALQTVGPWFFLQNGLLSVGMLAGGALDVYVVAGR